MIKQAELGTPHEFTVDKRTAGVVRTDDKHITTVTGLGNNETEKRNHVYINSRFETIGESVMTNSASDNDEEQWWTLNRQLSVGKYREPQPRASRPLEAEPVGVLVSPRAVAEARLRGVGVLVIFYGAQGSPRAVADSLDLVGVGILILYGVQGSPGAVADSLLLLIGEPIRGRGLSQKSPKESSISEEKRNPGIIVVQDDFVQLKHDLTMETIDSPVYFGVIIVVAAYLLLCPSL
ncbi:hypothetical protein V8E54_006199 [Elaphomyces granulatus]